MEWWASIFTDVLKNQLWQGKSKQYKNIAAGNWIMVNWWHCCSSCIHAASNCIKWNLKNNQPAVVMAQACSISNACGVGGLATMLANSSGGFVSVSKTWVKTTMTAKYKTDEKWQLSGHLWPQQWQRVEVGLWLTDNNMEGIREKEQSVSGNINSISNLQWTQYQHQHYVASNENDHGSKVKDLRKINNQMAQTQQLQIAVEAPPALVYSKVATVHKKGSNHLSAMAKVTAQWLAQQHRFDGK